MSNVINTPYVNTTTAPECFRTTLELYARFSDTEKALPLRFGRLRGGVVLATQSTAPDVPEEPPA
jgi:hypothetical protein